MASTAEEIAEFEECLIGAILVDASAAGRAIESVRGRISSADFTTPKPKRVFAAIEAICEEDDALPDIVPIYQRLKADRSVKPDAQVDVKYLQDLAVKGLVHNISFYTSKIVENARREKVRGIYRAVGIALDSGDSDDVLLQRTEQLAAILMSTAGTSRIRSGYEIGLNVIDQLREAKASGKERGLRTGIAPLDSHTNGLQPGTLTTLAARTSVGKSALGLQLADQACLAGHHPLYISMEMSGEELMGRNIANDTGIDSALIAGCALDGAMVTGSELVEIQASVERYRNAHLSIWDPPSRTITAMDIQRRAKVINAERPLSMIIVDYVDLLKPIARFGNRRDIELGDSAKALKSIATELRIPVVLLAQINRAGTNRDGTKNEAKPDLQHIADSDQLARDSDNVWILHRPRLDEPATSLLIRKQRGAPVCEIPLHMSLPQTKFTELPISRHPEYNSDSPDVSIDYDEFMDSNTV
ncbi:Replicative DNA helicase [Rosistilla ulvae]|uniref:DNA 5'-3' helicase n=1 Tax=Rosistilla ulvae TaxID=1930277 RepID=A0A517LU75_9BACT|nr:DnaB-like helicase C-terminal domain-containing protein [Rosistilla ulvae]QDS86173.1 Replicative DNA helicase [Rosistilla ulvae]